MCFGLQKLPQGTEPSININVYYSREHGPFRPTKRGSCYVLQASSGPLAYELALGLLSRIRAKRLLWRRESSHAAEHGAAFFSAKLMVLSTSKSGRSSSSPFCHSPGGHYRIHDERFGLPLCQRSKGFASVCRMGFVSNLGYSRLARFGHVSVRKTLSAFLHSAAMVRGSGP